jgi:hypothetical protein
MDIKSIIDEIVKKVKGDPKLLESFKDDPVKTIESISGIDIPDGAQDQIVSGVKDAISGGGISGIADAIKKIF